MTQGLAEPSFMPSRYCARIRRWGRDRLSTWLNHGFGTSAGRGLAGVCIIWVQAVLGLRGLVSMDGSCNHHLLAEKSKSKQDGF